MRKQFTFYKSFDDVFCELSDKQKVEFMQALLDVQFLRVRVEEITFGDKMLSIVWASIKHSLQTSIKGYLDSQKGDNVKNPYMGAYDTPTGGNSGPLPGVTYCPSEGGRQQDKEKGKDKEQVKKEFTFTLDKARLLSSTSKEYQERLRAYIESAKKRLTYESFYNQCEMKPYKYKNFMLAYNKWTEDEKPVAVHPANTLGGYTF